MDKTVGICDTMASGKRYPRQLFSQYKEAMMTTQFKDPEDAKTYVAEVLIGCKTAVIEEIECVPVCGFFEQMILNAPNTSPEIKEALQAKYKAQRTFKCYRDDGREVRFTVSPFRDGWDCSLIGDNGMCQRL